jgi:hypothetical protein
MSELLARRLQEVKDQLAVLPDELTYWASLTAAGEPYEKHHSQIVALSRQMLDLNARVEQSWNNATDFAALTRARDQCAAVHGVWNYFREKFVLRADRLLGGFLRAADAYVWACYEPVLKDRRERHPAQPFREPPLVTFDADWSPWAISRDRQFAPPGSETGPMTTAAFRQTLAAMPIALLGIPWTSTGRLPYLITLAHECGHVVETDFGLAPAVGDALRTAMAASALRDGWSTHWRKEVFADLFACLAAGPAFVRTLADVQPDSPDRVKILKRPTSDQRWGDYPPAGLRMALNLAALRHFSYAAAADDIATYWQSAYPAHAMADYEGELDLVVETVYAAAALPDALHFRHFASDARVAQNELDLGNGLKTTDRYDPRALVDLACTLARAQSPNAAELIAQLRDHIVGSRPAGQLNAGIAADTPAWLRTDEISALLFEAQPDGA